MTDLRQLATEQSNPRSRNLDRVSTARLLRIINAEDQSVPGTVRRCIPHIEEAVNAVYPRMQSGGRLYYIGAGTSGRLGCLDASEMPPTYGVPQDMVQGLMAGGFEALIKSREGAEDDGPAGRRDIRTHKISRRDAVIGLSASGRARYVRDALQEARRRGAFTACITSNPNSELIPLADVAIVARTGPEVVTGSTRMKAGTAQKLILNMFSTAIMVRLGRVQGNRMLDLQIKCEKLLERARNLVMDATHTTEQEASQALRRADGSVRDAIAELSSRPKSSRARRSKAG